MFGHLFDGFTSLSYVLLATASLLQCEEVSTESKESVPALGDGHGKPFGSGNPSEHVKIVDGFPSPREFFTKYVLSNTEPILMKGAIKHTRAYRLWSDDYFKTLDVPSDHTVSIESRKKENRTVPPVDMNFQSFVEVYQKTDQYLVDMVPSFLRGDVMVPGPLQCGPLLDDALVAFMMWFSNGGTSSVVHTDSVENINCLITGKKDFVIIPPEYSDFVDINHPEGSYSDLDVDAVDYNKFPGIAKVEKYLHANMEAGDCLYIPYLWIHQVRSYHRNIAVNVWWEHSKNAELNVSVCPDEVNPDMSLENAAYKDFGVIDSSPAVVRDFIAMTVKRHPKTFVEFVRLGFYPEEDEEEFIKHEEYKTFLIKSRKLFNSLDIDKNKILDSEDMKAMTDDDWSVATDYIKEVLAFVDEVFPPDDIDDDNEEQAHDEL